MYLHIFITFLRVFSHCAGCKDMCQYYICDESELPHTNVAENFDKRKSMQTQLACKPYINSAHTKESYD